MIDIFIFLGFTALYTSMQTFSIYAGDSGELVTAAATWSFAHPPGYPLYALLGNLLTHYLPFGPTPAWQVGLLSSVPMALALVCLFRIIRRVTGDALAGVLGAIFVGLLYPVWLYAITPEVFGLFAFFYTAILGLVLAFIGTRKDHYLLMAAFLGGMSMTHHHLILFLFLPLGIFIWKYSPYTWFVITKRWKLCGLLFFLGLFAYLYIPIASSCSPPLDYEHPANISGFIRLVTRASYGTFRASYNTGESLLDRFFNVTAFFQYYWKDFTIVGVGFSSIGLWYLWRRKRNICILFCLLILSWLGYFLYAGFPVITDFSLGTIERFFIVPYMVGGMLLGIGISGLIRETKQYAYAHHGQTTRIPFVVTVLCVSIIGTTAIRFVRSTYPKLIVLRFDTTLERLADDILQSVPPGGILSLSDDISIFSVDYAYFVQHKRQDVIYLFFGLLGTRAYREEMQKQYPSLVFPTSDRQMGMDEMIRTFIQANYTKHPIYEDRTDKHVPSYWVPEGLVVRYYPTVDAIPEASLMYQKNMQYWQTMQDPYQGALGTYQHLLLMDVVRYYAQKKLIFAQSLEQSGDEKGAERVMREVIALAPRRLDMYFPLITFFIEQKRCDEAYPLLRYAEPYEDRDMVLTTFHTFAETCPSYRDATKAEEAQYQILKDRYAVKLE